MPQSLARVIVHITFSTKGRQPSIARAVRPELNAYIAAALVRLDCQPIEVNAVASLWMKRHCPTFYWQSGYAVFSVSTSGVPRVVRYIADQEERHRQVSFQDELRAFLVRHGVAFDERYLWG